MMTGPIRLAVVDDHPLFREGVARSLLEIGGFEIVAEGGSADDAMRIAAETRPDILLLDLSMPGGGLQAVVETLRHRPDQKIVVLTVSEANDDIAQALANGARGYVLKGVGSKSLAEILRSVAAGETYLSPVLSARLLTSLASRTRDSTEATPISTLTLREQEILDQVAAGLSNKRIALALRLQEKTVKHHMTRILAKLGVQNRTEAAMLLRDAKDRRSEQ